MQHRSVNSCSSHVLSPIEVGVLSVIDGNGHSTEKGTVSQDPIDEFLTILERKINTSHEVVIGRNATKW